MVDPVTLFAYVGNLNKLADHEEHPGNIRDIRVLSHREQLAARSTQIDNFQEKLSLEQYLCNLKLNINTLQLSYQIQRHSEEIQDLNGNERVEHTAL